MGRRDRPRREPKKLPKAQRRKSGASGFRGRRSGSDLPRYVREAQPPLGNETWRSRYIGWVVHDADTTAQEEREQRVDVRRVRADAQFYAPLFWVSVRRICERCGRSYYFSAEEQSFWYETLKFPLWSRPIHCATCRKAVRRLRDAKTRYEAAAPLLPKEGQPGRGTEIDGDSLITLAECMVAFLEAGGMVDEGKVRRVRNLLLSAGWKKQAIRQRLADELLVQIAPGEADGRKGSDPRAH